VLPAGRSRTLLRETFSGRLRDVTGPEETGWGQRPIGCATGKGIDKMNRKDKIVSAMGATLAAGGIGGGVAGADARPRHARSFNEITASVTHDGRHNVY
jgi:hypothetical protein